MPLPRRNVKKAESTVAEEARLVDSSNDQKKQCALLTAKRNLLFDRFLTEPSNTLLALEIKAIDDRIAEHKKPAERKKFLNLGLAER